MSQENNKSFMEEIQGKYEIKEIKYKPAYYAEAGMVITLELIEKIIRPACPQCVVNPIIHGYIKNCKNRNNQWSFNNI